jgi:type I restriction enzyme S subunit
MKEGWKMVKLGDIATFVNGYAFKPSDWCEYGKPIIRIQNLTESQSHFNYCNKNEIPSKYNVKKGDILISWSATLGVYEWSMDDAWLNQHIFKVVFDKITIDKSFFRYSIEYSIDELSKKTNGATMKHIRKGDFDNTEINLPPLEDQNRIVYILDASFKKIDTLKKNAEENLKNAKALFQQVLAQELKPKEGWVEKKLEEIVTETCSLSYGIVQPGDDVQNGIPVVRPVDFSNDIFVKREGLKRTKKEISDAYQRTILTGNEILMCVRGTTGTMGFATDELKGCNVTR